MKASSKKVYQFSLVFILTCVFFQMRNSFRGQQVMEYADRTLENPTSDLFMDNTTLAKEAADTLCHTDEGIKFQTFSNETISTSNCFGYCRHKNPAISTFLGNAIEAPRISALCIKNPFHGFYDCIWPLIHYLTICSSLHNWKRPPVILVNNAELSERRVRSWVVKAQQAYLNGRERKGLIIEKNRVPGSQCVCFNSIVQFRTQSFWRPIKYQFTYNFFNSTILSSHPMVTKRNGLLMFRETILGRFRLDSHPLTVTSQIIVYGRQDTERRRWNNTADFVKVLKAGLRERVPVLFMERIPSTFEEQVFMFNKATLLIAPHGAAMVNTLFMRRGSAVLEIGSRHCLAAEDAGKNTTRLETDAIEKISDPNSWVPWHAQSLGIYHMTAPCIYTHTGNGDFVTENQGLLQLAVTLLMLGKSFKM